MSINISWKLSVQAGTDPAYVVANAVQVEALDRIQVTVLKTVTATVNIQPGAAGKVKFILIQSNKYDANLEYFVHDNTTPQRALTEALFLVGAGGLDLLEDPTAPLDKLVVTNNTGVDVVLDILVGRNAI